MIGELPAGNRHLRGRIWGKARPPRKRLILQCSTMPATNEVRQRSTPTAQQHLSVQENTPAGENIGDPFTATDTDSGDTLKYVLERNRRSLIRYR